MSIKRGNERVEAFEWITNRDLVDSAHMLMGKIDLDPASSAFANEYVGADNYYVPGDDPLNGEDPWFGNVYLFPPSYSYYFNKRKDKWLKTRGLSPSLTSGTALWFKTLKRNWLEGKVNQALFFTNYLDIVMYCQDIFDFPVCFLKARPTLIRHYFTDDKVVNKPTGVSLCVYLQPKDKIVEATENFIDIYSPKGRIIV